MAKRSTVTATIVLLALCLCTVLVVRKSHTQTYPVLGRDMLEQVEVIEDHRDALAHWAQKGLRNCVLLHIDAHDDMRKTPSEELARLKAACRRAKKVRFDAGTGRDRYAGATNATFVHAAVKLGILKKVVWVVPVRYGLFADGGANLTALLKMYGFAEEEIRGFRLQNGRYVGTTDGCPLEICDIRSLPDLREPVLFSVDVDYFPDMTDERDPRITAGVRETFLALFRKGYAIRDAVVAYSVNGGFLDSRYRWVGDLVVDTLRIPGLILQDKLPGRYAFLQRADLLLLTQRYEALLDLLAPFLDWEQVESAMYAYAAKAYQGLGRLDESLRCAETACVAERRYCQCLPELGTVVLEKSGLDSAERFFLRGYELSPDMDQGQFRYAMALKACGRHDDAIRYFSVFRACYGPFPADFYIGETFLLKGDEQSALTFYDRGRAELARNPFALAGFGDHGAIEKAATFYDRKGYGAHASELRNSLKSRGTATTFRLGWSRL